MNAPAVTSLNLDEGPQRLWHEWLSGYFDGAVHSVSGVSVSFPDAVVGFDVTDIGQPLSGVGIVVVAESEESDGYLAEEGRLEFVDVAWLFYVRAGIPLPGQPIARHTCRHAAQLLRGLLLDDAALLPLAQKGLMHLRPARAQPLPITDQPVRLLRVTGQLHITT